jgi:hypothetical protein
VPRTGIQTVDEQAHKIWVAARRGTVPDVTIARALSGRPNTKASGGGWRARIATLRLYNVVEKTKDGKFKLTDLGVALANTGDSSSHAQTLRSTLMSVTSYSLILTRYDGGQLPSESTIATEFEFDYEMSHTDAAAAAKVFVESARYAGAVDDSGNVNLAGATSPAAEPSTEDEISAQQEHRADDEGETDVPSDDANGMPETGDVEEREMVATDDASPRDQIPESGTTGILHTRDPLRKSPPFAVSVNLDMSKWAVKDVLKVLRVLGFEGPSEPK